RDLARQPAVQHDGRGAPAHHPLRRRGGLPPHPGGPGGGGGAVREMMPAHLSLIFIVPEPPGPVYKQTCPNVQKDPGTEPCPCIPPASKPRAFCWTPKPAMTR